VLAIMMRLHDTGVVSESWCAMTKTAAKPRVHFATMLSSAMDQLDISIRELSKQLGISYEDARRFADW
jgi:phage antirepressor YoqD-like protein